MQKVKLCNSVLLTIFLFSLFASAPVSAAPHTFTIEEVAGSSSAPTAPQSLVASPGNGRVTVTWAAPVSDGGSPITNYSIYRSTTSGAETFLTETGNVLSYVDSPLTNGQTYYYTVSAKNSVGEGPQSGEANATPQATIDSPPSASITSPPDGATVSNTVTVAATATDDNGVAKVDFYIDGEYKSTDATSPYTYIWDTTLYTNGNHVIKAMAYDTINQNTSTQITVNIDNYVNSPPVLSWTGEPNYLADGLDPESGDTSTQFVYRISYSDVDGDAPLLGYPKVHIRNSSGEIANSPFTMTAVDSNPFISGRKYSLSTPLPAGSFSYYFETYDSANNRVQTPPINAPTVTQLTTPTVSSTSPTNGATNIPFRNPVVITFSEPMSRAETEAAITTSPVISGGLSWNPMSDGLTISPSADMLVDTVYTVTVSAQAKSAAGVNMATPYVFSFRTSPPMNIAVTTPVNNSIYNSVLANITTSSSAGYCNAIVNDVSQGMSGTGAPWTSWYLQLTVSEGQNNVKFQCADSVGNVWQTVNTYYFTIDTVQPVLTFSTPTNNVINTSSVDIGITSNEPLSSVLLETDAVAQNISMSGSGTSWSTTKGSLSNGNHTLRIYGTDLAGNVKTMDSWVFVDVTMVTYNKVSLSLKDKSNNQMNNATIEIYDSNNLLVYTFNSSSPPSPKDFKSGWDYRIKYTVSGVILNLNNFIPTKNITLDPQFVDVFTGTIPQYVGARSPAIALNASEISGYRAEITLPLNSAANRILHCKSWNYASANCSNWEVNLTSDYAAINDGATIRFNATAFDAYMAGYYNVPAFCGNGVADAGETCSSCPADVGQCSVPIGGGGGGGDTGLGTTGVTYTTAAKIVGYPRNAKISPGTSLDIDITVKNAGNKPLNNLFIEFDNTWFIFDHKRISLAPEQSEKINVKLVAPAAARPGQYPVTLYLRGDSTDKVSFVLTVTETGGAASVAMIDTETVRKTIEELKQRIQLYSGQGYNLTAAKDLVDKAEEKFVNGDYLQASDYTGLANDILEKTIQKSVETKTFLLSYVLAGVIVVLLILLYYFYRKYQAEARNAGGSKEERTAIRPDAKLELPKGKAKNIAPAIQKQEEAPMPQPTSVLDEEVNMDDMLKRLEEIKKRLNK